MEPNYIYFSSIKYGVLKYIASFINHHEYSPTYLEIGKHFNFSRARAGKIVSELLKLNFISKSKSTHRNIKMSARQINMVPKLKYNKEYKMIDNNKINKLLAENNLTINGLLRKRYGKNQKKIKNRRVQISKVRNKKEDDKRNFGQLEMVKWLIEGFKTEGIRTNYTDYLKDNQDENTNMNVNSSNPIYINGKIEVIVKLGKSV
mgnify:FL=1|tara:strand:- start:778 stop:1389 length:612 start_codon:yes stop_codon:yes gene_type:complete